MVQYAVSQFFPASSHNGVELDRLPSFPDSIRGALLTGPPRCGKTALLLQYAWQLAAQGRLVVFICQKAKTEEAAATMTHAKDVQALQGVGMRYLETAQQLQKYASCLHLLPTVPDCLILDDIAHFLPRQSDRRAADAELVKSLAFLHEAAQFCSSRCSSGHCTLLVSDTLIQDVPQSIFIFRRWLPLLLTIEAVTGGYGGFTLAPSLLAQEHHNIDPLCLSKVQYTFVPHVGLRAVQIHLAQQHT